MPVIKLDATDQGRNICSLNIVVKVHFSLEYYRSPKAILKLRELEESMEELMKKYFDISYTSEVWVNDHDYNLENESDW